MGIFQEQNRQEIRQAIGYNLNDMILSEVTAAGTATTLIDTYALARGGDDEYNGRQVMVYDPAGTAGIVSGEKSFVSDFVAASSICTLSPAFSKTTADGDKYEMWRVFTVEEVNDAINQAIIDATPVSLVTRQTDDNFTFGSEYEYDWLVPYAFGLDFKGLSKVEYVSSKGIEHVIHDCEVAWDESTVAGVTAATSTIYNIQGDYCSKLTVAAAASTGIIATDSITSVDISDCDELQIHIRSSVALAAGDMQVLLDDTAACVSPVETLSIPTTLANTNTFHVIDLANPHLDTAIISIGINMVTDKTCILYIDRVRAVKSSTKIYKELNPEYWAIVKGDTPKLRLTSSGLSVAGENNQIRLTGYSAADIFSDDTTDSEVDPSWIIARVTGRLLIGHAKSARLDIKDKTNLAKYWLGEAESRMNWIRTKVAMNTRWV